MLNERSQEEGTGSVTERTQSRIEERRDKKENGEKKFKKSG